jgi:glyoxylase-like metal-dependent hydrolase (beta-lactamase superfamily II)
VYTWIGVNGDSNAAAVETVDGVVAIDAQQTMRLANQFRTALQGALGRRVTCLVNTHVHLDHTAGNAAFADVSILAHERTRAIMERDLGASRDGAWSITALAPKLRLFFGSNIQDLVAPGTAEETWFITRMSGPDYDTIVLREPTETFADRLSFACAGDRLRLEYWGPAHCDGDLVIWLPAAKVAILGDLMFHGRFPWLGDCDLDGWIERLGQVLRLDVDKVVPGHGPVASLKDVADFRALLMALRAAVMAAIKSGLSEDAAARDVMLPRYSAMPRYREWMPFNVRAAYRYLTSR